MDSFYRTTITFEVLSDSPIDENWRLDYNEANK